MSSIHIDRLDEKLFDRSSVQGGMDRIYMPFLRAFDRIVVFPVLVTLFFGALIISELLLLFLFFPLLIQTSFFAFSLAFVVLSLFSYLMIRQYLEAQKPEKISELVHSFSTECKTSLGYQEGTVEHHIALANAFCKFADKLHGREFTYYRIPKLLAFFSSSLERFSAYWHWEDLHQLKELLLKASLEEHLKLVRCEPTSLPIHAALANAYVMLSGLYLNPRQVPGYDNDQWIPSGKYNDEMHRSFRAAQEKAVQEFKILKEFAPNDPWVYTQLAYSYRDLQMPLEEMSAYEMIIKLRPNDHDSLFKLGVLYFQEGENALGLKVYEELKKAHFKKAEMLMNYYGAGKF